MAASTTSTALSSSSSAFLIHTPKPPLQLQPAQSSVASPVSCAVTVPNLPQSQSQSQSRPRSSTAAHGRTCVCSSTLPDRKTINARDVRAMATATGEAPADIATATELPDIAKTIQNAVRASGFGANYMHFHQSIPTILTLGVWGKIEDKYAVISLGAAGIIAFSASAGMISAIDRLPLVPGLMELVGIGYTGWFVYRNLVFKPDRDVLVKKIKDAYEDIIGGSS